jgi:hypothetical protein
MAGTQPNPTRKIKLATKNDVTGDTIQSRTNNKKYSDNWDKIFGKKDKEIIEAKEGKNVNKQESS